MTATRKEVSFKVSPHEAALIDKIVDRAIPMAREGGWKRTRLDWKMDVTACHANGNPLDLSKLTAFDDFNFAHDVFGIARHLDRETGELRNFFSPRCSKPEAQAA